MIRGTTAQYKFKLPYPKDELLWVTIKFWQKNNTSSELSIIKELSQCSGADNSTDLCVSLTEDETARFSDQIKASVQMRGCNKAGTVFGSKPKILTVYPMSDDILDEGGIIPTPPRDDGYVVVDGGEIASDTEVVIFNG